MRIYEQDLSYPVGMSCAPKHEELLGSKPMFYESLEHFSSQFWEDLKVIQDQVKVYSNQGKF